MLNEFRGSAPQKEESPTHEVRPSKNVYYDLVSVPRDPRTVQPMSREQARARYPVHRAIRTASGWVVECIHWCGRRTWREVAHRGEAIAIITGGHA